MFFRRTIIFKLILLFVLIFGNCRLSAQKADNGFFVVDSIVIIGNKVTKDYIILRELTFTQGDTVNDAELSFNRERVFSLGLFNKVEIFPLRKRRKTIVFLLVKESWYIYPLPAVWIQNSKWEQISYGLDFLWKNFRGRNETLHLVAMFGYNPFFAVSYFTPAFAGMKYFGFNISATAGKINNKSLSIKKQLGYDFKYKQYLFSLGFSKRFDQFNTLSVSGGFQYVRQPFDELSQYTASGKIIDRMPLLDLSFVRDTRDLKQFSSKGVFLKTDYSPRGFGVNGISYNIVSLDFRRYQPLMKKLTFKARLMFRHIWGKKIPYYDRSYFGYNEIIRGHGFDYTEGDNAVKTSFDLDYAVLPEWDFSIGLPLIPRKLTSARIGVHLSLFFDAGQTFDNNESLTINNSQSGYGVGIILLLLPYNALRIEYAFNELGKTEVLIGTGFAF